MIWILFLSFFAEKSRISNKRTNKWDRTNEMRIRFSWCMFNLALCSNLTFWSVRLALNLLNLYMPTDWIFSLRNLLDWMDVFGIRTASPSHCAHSHVFFRSLIGLIGLVLCRSIAQLLARLASHQTKSFIAQFALHVSRNPICILSKCINVLRLRMV